MFDKDILATFKKHLEGIDKIDNQDIRGDCLNKTRKIQKFGEDIKSANEFIGALQIIDIALHKIILQAQKILLEDEPKDPTFKNLESIVLKEINEIIDKCSFMGMELFNTTLSIQIDSKSIDIEVPNPTPLIQKEGYSSFINYLEDKKLEVQNTLILVSKGISDQKIFEPEVSKTSYDNFNTKDFLKMF
ncbi:flagellar FLiS export co-chaperone [Helicobacter sp. 13S00477-4]|uniref:flagellar FLiS export co-chaperone n=1 Tax=Helicobacter sp. 13S00477-4 TaxID=1905759 RepID=UPI000BA7A961|nr:flagellar FLiS export co-chaperone [Helicobacter sp. 13S00477-4]PAF50635.1 hypothetical protein BKH44_07240 [Helicobacter sp. 13S00477-4]